MIPALTAGQCDAIVSSMSDTEERRGQIDFTERYYKAPVRFVGRQTPGWATRTRSLAARSSACSAGTINQLFMEAHYPATPLQLYGNQEHVLLDLSLGRLDAVLGEAVQLDAGFLQTPAGEGFAFFGGDHFDPAIQGDGAAIGVRKEDARAARPASRRRSRRSGRTAPMTRSPERYFDIDIYGD